MDSTMENSSIIGSLPQLTADLRAAIDLWFVFSITIGVSACVLLLLLLATSLYHEKLRKGSKILVIHLLLVQLLICGFNFPILTVTSYQTLRNQTVSINCPVFLYLDIGSTHVENWASTLLAVNRYVAIIHPHQYKYFVSKTGLAITIILPWVIGLSDTLPIFLGIGGRLVFLLPYGCDFTPLGGTTMEYTTAWVTIGAYIPITVMGVTYITLFVRLAAGRCNGRVAVTECQVSMAKRARKIAIARILLSSFVWYCLCFLPDVVINTGLPYLYERSLMMHLWLVSILHIGFAGSTVIFIALGAEYRNGMRCLLRAARDAVYRRGHVSPAIIPP
ncbi:hypothetical protein BV898_12028 [Hypsibius exemplaris]|uniref:G-protein coupled receptors family 1 profile domain-containing protein n=1 Tax=Hypsibius exemplaris TaxID=2072580 RepID=A0A1W0WF33_HYPEX|nr:hypothetical protein BV898_12028 [Hypsibius exemplaris]